MKKLVLGTILAIFLFASSSADAVPKYNPSCMFNGCGGVSQEGQRAIFTFDDIYPGPDSDYEVYQRVNGQTSQLIDYPEGRQRQSLLQFVSDDARRAIVQTRSPLTSDDTDGWGMDFFAIQDGVPELISWDPADPSTKEEDLNMQLAGATDDARTLYFLRIPPGMPTCVELWERTEDSLDRVPTENCWDFRFFGVSEDGSSVFFGGLEAPFRYKDGTASLVNGVSCPAETPCYGYSTFGDSSADGETWVFSTDRPISPSDTDSDFDIYLRKSDGSHELLTEGDFGVRAEDVADRDWDTNAVALSSDLSRVLFVTHFPISPEDHDSELDIYLWTPEGIRLVSTGPSDVSPEIRNPVVTHLQAGRPDSAYRVDGSNDLKVLAFDSEQALVPEDQDDQVDVYAWLDGEIRLISSGPGIGADSRKAKLFGVSNDGTTISFSTPDPLLPVDTDSRQDIYAWTTTGLIRTGDASVSAQRRKRRMVLVSAESDAPRMKVIGRPRASGRRASVTLRCPKSEQTGPCRGLLKIRFAASRSFAGSTHFRVQPGASKAIRVKLDRNVPVGNRRAVLSIKAKDRLGNTSYTSRKTSFR